MSRIRLLSILGLLSISSILAACSSNEDPPPENGGEPKPPVDQEEEVSETKKVMERIQTLYDEIGNNVSTFSKSRRDVEAGAENSRLLIRLLESEEVKGFSSEEKFQDHLAIVLERAREMFEQMKAENVAEAKKAFIRLGVTCNGCHRDYRDDQPGFHREKPR